ncbi:cytidine deaminase [Parabacteroides sp. PF5-6]|uniref:cytidine deaminase n=1 Tax=Parabacteroides sp. PF5-6 TaxID=1742403 RepID=UPI0024068967|nr:cytidine deaminase [Parabacteroides sp. PF5-6]MDF9830995.1 cytidine deaminase [Parabacteroides sp. PF5-6]
MKEIKIETKIEVISIEELSPLDAELMNKAVSAAKDAYAPYSGFHVGVALMLTNGKIIVGNNQENAAYPSGLCAERVALFTAGAQYPNIPVRDIAIAAIKDGEVRSHISPCGACRQVMFESENRGKVPMRILLCGNEEIQVISSARDLLPLAFTL